MDSLVVLLSYPPRVPLVALQPHVAAEVEEDVAFKGAVPHKRRSTEVFWGLEQRDDQVFAYRI